MKFNINSVLVAFSLISTSFAQAQVQDNTLELSRIITLSEKTEEQTITIEVSGDVEQFKLYVMCDIEKGKATIEILDPSGSRQGKFTLGSDSFKSEKSKGEQEGMDDRERGKLEKNVKNPENGTWKIVVTQKKVKGHLSVRSTQLYRSK